jgi:hypothetical protein
MPITLTQEQDIMFQSYFTACLLVELYNNKFLESDYFQNMTFGAPQTKDALRSIGMDNRGCAMIMLYAMLVIPREVENVKQAYSSKYDEIQTFLTMYTKNTETNYKSDKPLIQYLRHIRNAVSHAHVEFRPYDSVDTVRFTDENHKKERFVTELPINKLGELNHRLQMIHMAYIQDLQQQSSQPR